MDDKSASELHKFIGLACDPRISSFIDIKKLCSSTIFDDAVDEAIDHVAKHGNLTLLNKLLVLLDGTPQSSKLLALVRSRVNCVVTDTKPPQLRKSMPPQPEVPHATVPPKCTTVNVAMATASRDVDERRSVGDIMDSRLVLPGSYGTGRRK